MTFILKVACRKGVQGRIGDENSELWKQGQNTERWCMTMEQVEQAANPSPEGDPEGQHELHPTGIPALSGGSALWVQLRVLGGLKQPSGKNCL